MSRIPSGVLVGPGGWAPQVSRSDFVLDAFGDHHRDSAPDLRIGITLAFMTEAPQKADDQRLTQWARALNRYRDIRGGARLVVGVISQLKEHR